MKRKKTALSILVGILGMIVLVCLIFMIITLGSMIKNRFSNGIFPSFNISSEASESHDTSVSENLSTEIHSSETQTTESQTTETQISEVQEEAPEDDPSEDEGSNESDASDQQNSVEVSNSDYMLPGSATRYIGESELYHFTKAECRIARNEIYARHGRIFKDSSLQKYFESKSWYKGQFSGDDFDYSCLNKFERANVSTIKEYESTLN